VLQVAPPAACEVVAVTRAQTALEYPNRVRRIVTCFEKWLGLHLKPADVGL